MSRRTLSGTVVSNKCQDSVVVEVLRRIMHEKYKKIITRSKRYMAHDATNSLNVGDKVTIEECAPISKRKTWTVVPSKSEKSS